MAQSTETGSFKKDKEIEINFGVPVDEAWAKNTANFSVYEKPDPDIKVPIESVTLDARKTTATLKFKDALNTSSEYIVEAKDVSSGGKILKNRVEFSGQEGPGPGSIRCLSRSHVDQ